MVLSLPAAGRVVGSLKVSGARRRFGSGLKSLGGGHSRKADRKVTGTVEFMTCVV